MPSLFQKHSKRGFSRRKLSAHELIRSAFCGTLILGAAPLASAQESALFRIDLASDLGTVKPGVFGVNGPDKYLDWAGNPQVTRRLKEGGFKVVRLGLVQDGLYHNRDLYPRPGEWKFETLDKMLRAIFDAGAEPLLIVTGFPAGVPHRLDGQKILSADWGAYAKFVAGVVRHYNVEHALGPKRRIRYWELWNEPTDEPDGKFANREAYAEFVKAVAPEMRRMDPQIQLIGPVYAWSDLGENGWLAFAAKELGAYFDILCWHDYGAGADQPDAERMAWPRVHYDANARLAKTGPWLAKPDGRRFGAAITEYNMSWQDGPPDYMAKYRNVYNAAFLSASLVRAIRGDLDLFCVYVFAQGGKNTLGLVDSATFRPYLPFRVYPAFASHAGERKLAIQGEADGLEVLATKAKDGVVTVFAVNTTGQQRHVSLALTGPGAKNFRQGDLALPPLSLTVLSTKKEPRVVFARQE